MRCRESSAHRGMRARRVGRTGAAATVLSLAMICVVVVPAFGQENTDCLKCHSTVGLQVERDGRTSSLFVDAERFAASVHADLDCITCHQDLDGIETFPHEKKLAPVNCGQCHEEDNPAVAAYWASTHGQQVTAGVAEAPRCQDCHGNHYIIPLSAPNSAISPFNIPQMCAQCHAEGAEVARTHAIPQEQILKRYKQSIHGEGLFKQGLVVTAVCTSCHTGHNVLPHSDPKSTIHKDNIVATCEKCHGMIETVHRKIISGELWEREGAVPICVECHSPHEIRKVFYDTNMSDADCLRCHGDPKLVAADGKRSLFVSVDEHSGSVHGRKGVTCAQCHIGITPSLERACETISQPAQCGLCHEPAVADYGRGRHGMLHAGGDVNAPYCSDCHGSHGILEHVVPDGASPILDALIRGSPTYGRNLPELCGKCHREGAVAAVRNLGPENRIVEQYTMSIHGRGLLESGLIVTATCTSCHTPHKELPAADSESSVHRGNIARTCGKCHDGIYEQYRKSIHSEEGNPDYVQLRGMPALPHCNDCHTPHSVVRTDQAGFQLGIMRQCGKCHEDLTKSYFDTYHGKSSELGDTARAKCHDCHGAHNILPPSNLASSLNRNNIVATCAKCHPGSNRKFTGYLTHATHHDPDKYPILFYTFWAMTTLLVGTFTFFGLHTLCWLPRSWKLRKELKASRRVPEPGEKQFLRFRTYVRVLHIMIIVSFFGLAITGMMVKFAHTKWAGVLAVILGGTNTAGWIHRACAIITFTYMGMHIYDVIRRYRKSGRTVYGFLFGRDTIMPRWSDVNELFRTLNWLFGRGPRPIYGRWTYWEKFDYFAVFWGVTIIGSTGLCLWFPEVFTRLLPGWSINVATIIHSDEALLATGFIFTIHFFNTHFRPEKYPMDTVIFTGRMTMDELKHDKPRLYEQMLESGELEERLVDPVPDVVTRFVKICGFLALGVGFTLVALIIYAMLFSYP